MYWHVRRGRKCPWPVRRTRARGLEAIAGASQRSLDQVACRPRRELVEPVRKSSIRSGRARSPAGRDEIVEALAKLLPAARAKAVLEARASSSSLSARAGSPPGRDASSSSRSRRSTRFASSGLRPGPRRKVVELARGAPEAARARARTRERAESCSSFSARAGSPAGRDASFSTCERSSSRTSVGAATLDERSSRRARRS